MNTSYDVRVWKTEPYKGKSKTTYYVRWAVGKRRFKRSFATAALADSFRSELTTTARKGEAFHLDTGLPVSHARTAFELSWYRFACEYVEMKWPELAGNSRKGVAETLTTVTVAMLSSDRGKPDGKMLRRALNGWAFNLGRRSSGAEPAEIASAAKWAETNTLQVGALADPGQMRKVLSAISVKLDGSPAAASVVRRKRAVLFNALEYAVERKLLDRNPILNMKWKPPKTQKSIDKRVVVNPQQAARLLDAVKAQQPSGPRMVAFFAVMYYAGCRPAEAVNLRKQDLALPEHGWGELLLWESAPETGASWSSTGKRRDRRGLKHRASGDIRPVPCAPRLTELLHEHLRQFGTDADGFLFRGVREVGHLSESTYSRAWRNARKAALTPGEYESPLARRAYHLRHAAVSTWLTAGVAPTQVAEWAGHSVAVLLQIYAKCLAGQEEIARQRIERLLGGDLSPGDSRPPRNEPDAGSV